MSTVAPATSGRTRAGALGARFAPATLAVLAMGGLMLGAALGLMYLTRGTTFWFDDWQWALERSGSSPGTFLNPHNEHLSLVPLVLYRALFATAGLDNYEPFRALVVTLHLAVSGLVFLYALRRIPPALALCAGALVLLLGPGWQNILWPFQISWLISLGAGLGALLLLDRNDRLGDVGACALLAVALGSSGLGVPFLLGAIVELVLGRRGRRDAWIVLVPLVLYGLWWIVFQESGGIVLRGLPAVPEFVASEIAATVAGLLGLAGPYADQGEGSALTWGRPLALLAGGAVVWRLSRLGRPPARVLTLLTIVMVFWGLTALTRNQYAAFFGDPYPSRYIYTAGVVLVLLAAELLRGVRFPARLQAAVAALVAVSVLSNLGVLIDSGRYLREQAAVTRAQLGALHITRDMVAPGYIASPFFGVIKAGPYFAAEARWGTPAYSQAQLAAAPDYAKAQADKELALIHDVVLRPGTGKAGGERPAPTAAGGTVAGEGSCAGFRPQAYSSVSESQRVEVEIPSGGLLITAEGGPATVGVGRFSSSYQRIGKLAADAPAVLRVAGDRSPQPWRVQLLPTDRVTVCGL